MLKKSQYQNNIHNNLSHIQEVLFLKKKRRRKRIFYQCMTVLLANQYLEQTKTQWPRKFKKVQAKKLVKSNIKAKNFFVKLRF